MNWISSRIVMEEHKTLQGIPERREEEIILRENQIKRGKKIGVIDPPKWVALSGCVW